MTEPPRTPFTILPSFVLLFCFLVLATPDAMAQDGPPPTPVMGDPVVLETVQSKRRVTGEIQPRRIALVASQEDGLVIELPFDEGEVVKRGEVLARLDANLLALELEDLQSQQDGAAAAVDVRRAELSQYVSDLTSVEHLHQRDAAKPKELLDAQTDVLAAKAQLLVAERVHSSIGIRIKRLQQRLDNKTIVAPFDGMLTRKQTEVGQWVNEGGAIVEFIEVGRVDAVFDVPETYINQIERGQVVLVTLPAFVKPIEGKIRAIIPMGDPRAHTYPVKVEMDDLDGKIKPGMTADVWAATGSAGEAMTIRKDAVLRNEAGPYIFIAQNGVAAIVSVQVRYSVGPNRVVVSAGRLQPGDMVLYEGNERLYPTARVQVLNHHTVAEESASEDTEADHTATPPPSTNKSDG